MSRTPSIERVVVRLFLAGDCMPARGVDCVLPYPLDDARAFLRETCCRHARDYVRLALDASALSSAPRHTFTSLLGDLLDEKRRRAPCFSMVNLETALTSTSDDFWLGKPVCYRASERNGIGLLETLGVDCVTIANNHALGFSLRGFEDTVRALEASETLDFVGGGLNADEAFRWRRFESGGVSALGVCFENSGVPREWRATSSAPGLALMTADDDVRRLLSTVREEKRRHPSSTIIVSCHWGSNWGWDVSPTIEHLARRLVESGCDIVHGHSSHHPRRCELYEDKLIVYGCGELLNDYEGIGDHAGFPAATFAGDLRFAYFPEYDVLDASARRVFARMDIVAFRQANCFALKRADADAVERVRRALAPQYALGGLRLERDARAATLVATPTRVVKR